MTFTFLQIERLCKSLGLKKYKGKKGDLWKGFIDGKFVCIPLHIHGKGRDIPNGTLKSYMRQLNFKSEQELNEYLKEL